MSLRDKGPWNFTKVVRLETTEPTSLSPRRGEGQGEGWIRTKVAILSLSLTLLGCRSAPPPPPAPPAVSLAARAEDQGVKLSQQQNWSAAARAWQLAADRSALLNNLAREAIALHNLAQAEREIGQRAEARTHFEQAADLNERLGLTLEWWRNQIALLQVEAEANDTGALKARFEKLSPLANQLRDHSVQGLFLNERGLWEKSRNEPAKAEKTFTEAELAFKAANDSFGLATISANRAQLFEAQANYTAAAAAWQAALAKFQSLADPPGITRALAGQGRSLLAANQDLPTAEDLLRRAARNYLTLQDTKQAQATLELLARCLSAEGKDQDAESLRKRLPIH